MLGMRSREHLALAEKLVIVFLGLGVEARVVVGVPGLRTGRCALQCLVEPANSPRTGIPAPVVVAAVRLLIAKANESAAALSLSREHRIGAEQPQPFSLLQLPLDRHPLH